MHPHEATLAESIGVHDRIVFDLEIQDVMHPINGYL
jgi:hypothetical protein